MDRAKRIDKKKSVICLIVFTPGSLKYHKRLIAFVFSADYSIFFTDSIVFYISNLKRRSYFKVH